MKKILKVYHSIQLISRKDNATFSFVQKSARERQRLQGFYTTVIKNQMCAVYSQ